VRGAIEIMTIQVHLKRLSGEIITLEMESKEFITTENLKKKLNELDSISFPAHRTSLLYDDEGYYHIMVSTELNVSLSMNVHNKWSVHEYYECCNKDCWKCDEDYNKIREYNRIHYNNILKEKRYHTTDRKNEYLNKNVEIMNKYGWDGCIIDEYCGAMICYFHFPITTQTSYHLYVIMIGKECSRDCKIMYQFDTNDKDEYKAIMEEIQTTKCVKGVEDYKFSDYFSGKEEDDDRNDCMIVLNENGEIVETLNSLSQEKPSYYYHQDY
jgi:hypothetical protein